MRAVAPAVGVTLMSGRIRNNSLDVINAVDEYF